MTTTSKWSIYIFHKVRRKCPHRLERIEHHIGNSSPRYSTFYFDGLAIDKDSE
jgi:hypothetical protein